ncbi:S1 RNA-binding domain-containing protein [Patescibacteria group bacterium]|nr:S1 RNA-binding domain-containing protein [Patescibacteria group bacterium]
MKKLLEKNDLMKPPQINDIIEGKIIRQERGAMYLDLGIFGTGIIYGRELYEAKSSLRDLKAGDSIFAKVMEFENEEGYVELSISQAGRELNWETLKQKKEIGEEVTVKISGANRGGLLAEVLGIRGFLPVSQLSPEHYPRVEGGETSRILQELQKFIGTELKVQVFDLDQKQDKLILSEKAKKAERVREVLKNYNINDVIEGEITGIVDFGAFIRFPAPNTAKPEAEEEGTLEGLIHISELDWQIIGNPSEIVKVGQIVKAKIIEISDAKVFLSLKALKKDPWEDIEKKYKKGDVVKGKASKLNPFGAFIQVAPTAKDTAKGANIQGLCHISEFGSQKKMEDSLEVGKKYNFEILLIDPKEHRMSLRLIK